MLTNKRRFFEKTFHRFFRGRDLMNGNEGNRCWSIGLLIGRRH